MTTTKKHRTDVKSSTPTAENEQNRRFIILEPPSTPDQTTDPRKQLLPELSTTHLSVELELRAASGVHRKQKKSTLRTATKTNPGEEQRPNQRNRDSKRPVTSPKSNPSTSPASEQYHPTKHLSKPTAESPIRTR